MRSCRRRSENDRRRGIEVLPTVVFADSECVQPDLIGMFDLLDKVAQTVRRADRKTVVVVCRGEAVNANLHLSSPCFSGAHAFTAIAQIPCAKIRRVFW